MHYNYEKGPSFWQKNRKRNLAVAVGALILLGFTGSQLIQGGRNNSPSIEQSATAGSDQAESQALNEKITNPEYIWHKNVTSTIFWAGEPADDSNENIQNHSSAWTENWVRSFGGTDDPKNRCGNFPCGFTPKENPFYFALPFNDLTGAKPKSEKELEKIFWYPPGPANGKSIIKNRWIEVTDNKKSVYAQWEDVGPKYEDDSNYVFGTSSPKYGKSGLDLSPATANYLKFNGLGPLSWRFVDEKDVPDGPWKKTITTSGIDFTP